MSNENNRRNSGGKRSHSKEPGHRHSEEPGWHGFIAFEAEPHHESMSGPKLIKRGTELGASVVERLYGYNKTQCQAKAMEILWTSSKDDLPEGCLKYQDVVQKLNRKRTTEA